MSRIVSSSGFPACVALVVIGLFLRAAGGAA